MWYPILVILLTGYLLGNLNGAVSISVLLSHDDVRTHGSGNAGLTNFVRNFGVQNGALVVLVDAGKTAAACLSGQLILAPLGYGKEGMMLGAIAVTLGHNFPALLGFHGGKGILCSITAAFLLDWRAALIILAVFCVSMLLTQIVSLSSILGAVSYCIMFSVFYHENILLMAGGVFLGLLAIFMHRGNISRLVHGTEPKINLFRKEGSQ